MIGQGQVVVDTAGRSYLVGPELAAGGQGVILDALELKTNERPVLKVYYPNVATPDACTRLDALIALNLSARSPALCAPIARLASGYGLVGAVQPRAQGEPLEDLLQSGTCGLPEAVGIGIALCRALMVLDDLGVAHGDLAASNILVKLVGDYYEISLLDFDNASIPGAPAPTFRGQDLYAAPELLSGSASATVTSDRFALAVLLYEVLYGRHPFAVATQGPVDFTAYVAMLSQATWKEDPIEGTCPDTLPGLPVGVLPRAVHALFRAGLQVDPLARPSARAWEHALRGVLDELFICDACSKAFANDPACFACPWCSAPADALELQINGRSIVLDAMTTIVGRDDVGADTNVSREHVALRRRGFALVVLCLSANGLGVQTAGTWRVLAKGEEVVASVGDRIVFAAGVEGLLSKRSG